VLPHLLQSLFLAAAAFLGGIINSIAGGGSFIAFPALIAAGLLPIQANATNTVALWPGQFTSIAGYREDLRKNLRLVLPVATVAAIGGLTGDDLSRFTTAANVTAKATKASAAEVTGFFGTMFGIF